MGECRAASALTSRNPVIDMYPHKLHITQHQRKLDFRALSVIKWLLLCFLVVLVRYYIIQPTPLFADGSLVTQETRYHMPEAGELFQVWGINGWAVVSEELRPASTVVQAGVMHTPMSHEGDTFVVPVQVPVGVTMHYGFWIAEDRSSGAIEGVLHAEQGYHTIGTRDDAVVIQTTVTPAQSGELPSAFDVTFYLLMTIGAIIGVAVILIYGRPFPNRGISVRPYEAVQDSLFLGFVVLLSLILYVWQLGFYSDDWAWLSCFSASPDRSVIRLFQSCYSPHVAMRPVQILYLSGLYWLFGLHPLGYHWANAPVLLSSVVLFYLVLCELGLQRRLALTVPLVYGLLPHYSTDRFWFAAFQANLSIALYFLSFYSDLRALRAPLARLWGWRLLSILSLLGSTLAYEVTLPLFFLNLLVVWYRGRQRFHSASKLSVQVAWVASLVANLLALVMVLVFKALTTTRLGNQASFLEQSIWIMKRAIAPIHYGDYDYGLNFKQAFAVNFGDYAIGLARIVWRILNDYPDAALFALGGLVSLVIFGYLYRAVSQSAAEEPGKIDMLRLIAWGLVAFALGYAIFLTNSNIQITLTGMGNRTAIAAAAGVALSVVGLLGFVSSILPSSRLRQRFFCTLVTLLCLGGFLITNTLASFWIVAYRQQEEILTDIYQQFPIIPEGSTLILDGICPYVGPAIVFESPWDLEGVLHMHYGDFTLQADVVRPNLKVREDGLHTSSYGQEYVYPYGKLIVYHFDRKISFQLSDAKAAHFYFETLSPDPNISCPHDDHWRW